MEITLTVPTITHFKDKLDSYEKTHILFWLFNIGLISVYIIQLLSNLNVPLFWQDYSWIEAAKKSLDNPTIILTHNLILSQWRPLTLFFFTIITAISKNSPIIYRLVHSIIFLFIPLLIYYIVKDKGRTAGLVAATAFLTFESNLYYSTRVDAFPSGLSAVLLMFSFIFATKKIRYNIILSTAFAILAILAKEEAFVIVPILIAYAFFKNKVTIPKRSVFLRNITNSITILEKKRGLRIKIKINELVIIAVAITLIFILISATKPYFTKPLPVLLNPTPERDPGFYLAEQKNITISKLFEHTKFYLNILMRSAGGVVLGLTLFLLLNRLTHKPVRAGLSAFVITLIIFLAAYFTGWYFMLIVPILLAVLLLRDRASFFYLMWATVLTITPFLVVATNPVSRYLLIPSIGASILIGVLFHNSECITRDSKSSRNIVYAIFILFTLFNLINSFNTFHYEKDVMVLTHKLADDLITHLPAGSLVFIPENTQMISRSKTSIFLDGRHEYFNKNYLLTELFERNRLDLRLLTLPSNITIYQIKELNKINTENAYILLLNDRTISMREFEIASETKYGDYDIKVYKLF